MSHYINMLFSTELTCLPRVVDNYIGDYYSNTVGNALTWVFVMWLLVHYIFDAYLNVLLKQMHYKQFVRTRLLNALWYCGFYGTGFLYCIGTIVRNNTSVFEYRRNLIMDGGTIPLHLLMGLGLIGTFFFQSFSWTAVKYGYDHSCLTFLALTLLPITTFYSRRTELLISLLALISLIHFIYNGLRCLTCTIRQKGCIYLSSLFYISLGLFVFIHIVVIPIFFIVPLIYNFRYGATTPMIILALNLILWWVTEAFSNPLYKFIKHWIRHSDIKNARICPGRLVECALFAVRDDVAFNMCVERWEIKQRQEKSIARRKPKDRAVFVQTLKCMVAIRRKLNKKRTSESSESDSESSEQKDKPPTVAESSDEESSDEDGEVDPMRREYQEETARALMEDRQADTSEVESSAEVVLTSPAHEEEDKKND